MFKKYFTYLTNAFCLFIDDTDDYDKAADEVIEAFKRGFLFKFERTANGFSTLLAEDHYKKFSRLLIKKLK